MKFADTSSPFDAVAATYDETFSNTALGKQLRGRVHALAQLFYPPGTRVLELNCGTGEDAVWLSRRGCCVTATDNASAMLEVTAEKLRIQPPHAASITAFADLRNLTSATLPYPAYDRVWSNFGGLNCLSPEALRRLSQELAPLLADGGQFTAVVMGRFCFWEIFYFLLKGQRKRAFLRFRQESVPVALSPDRNAVETWYYTPSEFCLCFPDFKVGKVSPVGFWLPPSYVEPFFKKHAVLAKVLHFLEKHCTFWWMSSGADHFLVHFKKK
jgi:SAM-dependent methyltransferase